MGEFDNSTARTATHHGGPRRPSRPLATSGGPAAPCDRRSRLDVPSRLATCSAIRWASYRETRPTKRPLPLSTSSQRRVDKGVQNGEASGGIASVRFSLRLCAGAAISAASLATSGGSTEQPGKLGLLSRSLIRRPRLSARIVADFGNRYHSGHDDRCLLCFLRRGCVWGGQYVHDVRSRPTGLGRNNAPPQLCPENL